LIKIENIKKTYSSSDEGRVLKGINLEFGKTGFVCILGKSGSGKSTLLNIIGGLDKGEGTISYEDVKVNHYDSKKIDLYRSKNIGYIFQNYLLLQDLTVYENIDVALSLAGVNNAVERKNRIEKCLKIVGLDRYKRRMSSALSGGQQQRVAIARALAKDSKILICDEPTGNLDSINTIEIMKILKSISKTKLIIMVTHNNDMAKRFADRIINLVDGEIISDKENQGKGASYSKDIIELSSLENETIKSGNLEIVSYKDKESSEPLKLSVIEYQGKVKIVIESSHQLLNDDYAIIDTLEAEEEEKEVDLEFNNSYVGDKKVGIFKRIKSSCQKVYGAKKATKVLYTFFSIFGILISFFIYFASNLNSIYVSEDESKSTTDNYFMNRTIFSLDPDNNKQAKNYVYRDELYNWIEEDNGIIGVRPVRFDQRFFSHHSCDDLRYLNKTYTKGTKIKIDVVRYNDIEKEIDEFYLGRNIENDYEVLITKSYLKLYLEDYRINNKTIEDSVVLDSEINFGFGGCTFKVVGVVESDANSVICKDDEYLEFVNGAQKSLESNALSYIFSNAKVMTDEEYLEYKGLDQLPKIYRDWDLKPGVDSVNVYYTRPVLRNAINYSVRLSQLNMIGALEDEEEIIVFDTKTNKNSYKKFLSLFYDKLTDNSKFSTEGLPLNFKSFEKIEKDERLITYLNDNNVNTIGNGDVIISKDLYDIIKTINPNRTISSCSIVGYYESDLGIFDIYTNNVTYDVLNIKYMTPVDGNLDLIVVEDYEKANEFLKDLGYKIVNMNDYYRDQVYELIKRIFFIVIIAIAIIVSLFMFMTNRSKMIKNIYTIGVFRALGVHKKTIYKTFFIDSLTVTTLTMALSYTLTYVAINLFSYFYKTPPYEFALFAVGFGVMYLVNLFFSMMPLILLLKKTPREITIKYDI